MRNIGIEFRKSYARRLKQGFFEQYLSGENILDIGYKGGDLNAVPITENAIGVGLDYPGYDGVHLPFPDQSQDAIFASHVLEHISEVKSVLADWYRALRVNGYLLVFVPHKYLYERKPVSNSLWNGDHKRFLTPASLLALIEDALPPNGYRVRHLADNDVDFDYSIPPEERPVGAYEIELIIQKILRPKYSDQLELPSWLKRHLSSQDDFFVEMVGLILSGEIGQRKLEKLLGRRNYIISWHQLRNRLADVDVENLRAAILQILPFINVDEQWYVKAYPRLRSALESGNIKGLTAHWIQHGYFEGRDPQNAFDFARC